MCLSSLKKKNPAKSHLKNHTKGLKLAQKFRHWKKQTYFSQPLCRTQGQHGAHAFLMQDSGSYISLDIMISILLYYTAIIYL